MTCPRDDEPTESPAVEAGHAAVQSEEEFWRAFLLGDVTDMDYYDSDPEPLTIPTHDIGGEG